MILLYFAISSLGRIEVWKHRNLALVAPFTRVEDDCKMQAKHNTINMKMFHSHIAWAEASIGNNSPWTSLLFHIIHILGTKSHYEVIKTATSMKAPAKSAATFKALLHKQNFGKEQKYKGDSAHNILVLNNKTGWNIAYLRPKLSTIYMRYSFIMTVCQDIVLKRKNTGYQMLKCT